MTRKVSDVEDEAIFLALTVLEPLPDALRPDSDIDDMRALQAGRSTRRDDVVITQAVATALAFFTYNALHPLNDSDDLLADQLAGFTDFFAAAASVEPRTFATYYSEACRRMAKALATRPRRTN